jgi:hypothetical protein
VVAFNLYHFEQSAMMRSSLRRSRWLPPIAVLLVVSLVLAAVDGGKHLWPILPCVLVWAILYVLFYSTAHHRRSIRKRLARFLNENTTGLIGRHELELSEDGLIGRSAANETKTAYSAIQKIVSTNDHTFVYISGMSGHIVPHRSIPNSQAIAFVSELHRRTAPSAAASLPPTPR